MNLFHTLQQFHNRHVRPNDHENNKLNKVTHLPLVSYISVTKLVNIGPDNGSSPDQRQAITWTNAQLMSIKPIGTNSSEILI